ncbi:MAG: efflux RND transporter periplasmic adaptor subunit [Opitutaceae bacterium]|nr:efflux RND transporter periplasmic adaptor subunit [Opitutaceae bacterium]
MSPRLAFILLVPLALGACGRPPRAESPAALPSVRVSVAPVQRESRPALLPVPGTVRAVRRAALAAKVAGTVEPPALALGQAVRAGDVLLKLAAAEHLARVAQGRALLAQVERELARERQLAASGAGTPDTVRSLEDRRAQAQAALREAEAVLDYAVVRAPFDGVIGRKFVEPGDFAGVGAPLLQLDGRDALEIEVAVPESLAALALGAKLAVEVPAAGLRFDAAVAEVSSAADSATRTVTAKLSVPAGTAARPGQFAQVLVPATAAPVLLVPASAVSPFGQMERVFVAAEGRRAVLRLVKTGARHDDRVEITSGLAAGERIVVAPPATLRDGQPLETSP